MQDEVRDKSVAFVIHMGKDGAKLTSEVLKWAMLQYRKQAQGQRHGKQNVKSLVRQGAGVQNIEITDKNIKSFEQCARKYGIDFSVKKDPAQGRYLVFFKTRDADALNAAFAEYTAKTLNRGKEKPSLKKQLSHFKQASLGLNTGREKKLQKGGIER